MSDYNSSNLSERVASGEIMPAVAVGHAAGAVLAGPCSAESQHQVLDTAAALAKGGVKVFRAGLWKPRTRPGGFNGVGEAGLSWLKEVKERFGMLTATEVATPAHVLAALDAGIDLLWIGARTTVNPFAVQDIADTISRAGADIPMLVKNPPAPDIDLWVGAVQRFVNAGLHRISVVHRGFAYYGNGTFRNSPQWEVPLELHRRFPRLQMLCDPSHIGGRSELIASISQQAVDLGFDGLMIESHTNPSVALSDARQQVTPEELLKILGALKMRRSTGAGDELAVLRSRVDQIDSELISLIAKRLEITDSIGRFKRASDMAVFQPARYEELISTRLRQAAALGVDSTFASAIFSAIHAESVRRQLSGN